MERDLPAVGDIIIDHEDDLTGVVHRVDVDAFMRGTILIHWFNLGTFATPPAMARDAILSGDWTIQADLTKAWAWVFPD